MIERMENTLYNSLFQLILELTLRVASCDDGMIAQIIVQCIPKFDQRKKIPRTTEYALLILSMVQLNVQLCSRFDHVWQKMNQQDSTFKFEAVIGKCDPMIKSLYDALNGQDLKPSLDASFHGRVLHFKGEHVISGVDWKWLIMIDEHSQPIRLIDKSLFRLDLENSTLERWVYKLDIPAEFGKIAIDSRLEQSIQWFRDHVLPWVPGNTEWELRNQMERNRNKPLELMED